MTGGVHAFGPSLVDISAKLTSTDFDAWCSTLDVGPGGWTALPDWTSVNGLIGRLVGAPITQGHEFAAIISGESAATIRLAAGSSTLGMLSAMPERLRRDSTYVSALAATELPGSLDPFSEFFATAVAELRLTHRYRVLPGHNPVSFVVYASTTPDRVLATYPGVARSHVPLIDPQRPPELLLVDTYEMLAGASGAALHQLITKRLVPVGLSLGNEGILIGAVRRRIRAYLDGGLVEMVFGNAAEYRALYPKLPAAQTTIEGFRDHPVRHSVQYSLLTDGEQGLAAHVELDFAHAPGCVVPEAAIVNTSGAGDTAAGVFVAGILDGRRPADVLALCAEAAARVITVPESRIVR